MSPSAVAPAPSASPERATALVVVDVQRDFCEGGSLAVAGGAEVARRVSQWAQEERPRYRAVVATRDEHVDPGPHFSDHPDFRSSWPRHCVAGTPGAQPHPELRLSPEETFAKGRFAAAYSGFEGISSQGLSLEAWLRARGIQAVHVVGLATDYCVAATAEDAVAQGFHTTVLVDLCAGVNPAQVAAATRSLSMRGAVITTSAALRAAVDDPRPPSGPRP